MAAFDHADGCPHPGRDPLLHLPVGPVSHHNFSLDSHTAHDMAVLSVAMGCLILVHKIHINGVIGNLLVKLGVQMQQRFPVLLQPQDPGLCRGERVHPGDHARTFLIRIRLIKRSSDQFICDQCRFPDHLKRQNARLVQFFHNDPGMPGHIFQTLITVKILRTCAKPKFVVLYCFHRLPSIILYRIPPDRQSSGRDASCLVLLSFCFACFLFLLHFLL